MILAFHPNRIISPALAFTQSHLAPGAGETLHRWKLYAFQACGGIADETDMMGSARQRLPAVNVFRRLLRATALSSLFAARD